MIKINYWSYMRSQLLFIFHLLVVLNDDIFLIWYLIIKVEIYIIRNGRKKKYLLS